MVSIIFFFNQHFKFILAVILAISLQQQSFLFKNVIKLTSAHIFGGSIKSSCYDTRYNMSVFWVKLLDRDWLRIRFLTLALELCTNSVIKTPSFLQGPVWVEAVYAAVHTGCFPRPLNPLSDTEEKQMQL